MKIIILFTAFCFISACSSTGVTPFAAGTYKVESSHVLAGSAKENAYEEATNYCSTKEKKMEIVTEPEQVSERYPIVFKCI